MVIAEVFETPASGSGNLRSIQLSYATKLYAGCEKSAVACKTGRSDYASRVLDFKPKLP